MGQGTVRHYCQGCGEFVAEASRLAIVHSDCCDRRAVAMPNAVKTIIANTRRIAEKHGLVEVGHAVITTKVCTDCRFDGDPHGCAMADCQGGD